MRILVGVGLLLLCPGLVGCTLFQKKRNDSTTSSGDAPSGSKPFLGMPASRPDKTAPIAAAPAAPNPDRELEGMLAGYVVDRFNKPATNGAVRVIDLTEPQEQGKLDVLLVNGQFYVSKLRPDHNYKLIARVNDGSHLLAGYREATPPNPRLAIVVSEDLVGPDTPPLPGPITLPGQAPLAPEKDPKQARGTAELGTPIRPAPDNRINPGPYGVAPPVRPGDTLDPSHVATLPDSDVERVSPRPRQETISVPGPGSYLPPPPQFPSDPLTRPGGSTQISPALPSVAPPVTAVPSCLLIGKKLENLALLDLDGNAWEYRKERHGKLMLLHFWPSSEAEFLPALGDLRELQAQYERQGLQVVGIAYQPGDFDKQVTDIRQARIRYGVNYLTLVGGGERCPVRQQFLIERLPELVLLDANGQIIWRSNGAPDKDRMDELNLVIRKQLGSGRP